MSAPEDDGNADEFSKAERTGGGRPEQPGQAEPPGQDESQPREGPAPEEWRSAERDERPPQRRDPEQQSELQLFLYDLASSVLAVLVVGAYLFSVSGVWPPLVAVESRSMVPNMQVNDLVFVMEEHRFPGENAHGETGVVTHQAANGSHQQFGRDGDVIVFAPDGNNQTTPIIHRAMFWVEEGEEWYQEANQSNIGGADSCEELQYCPAPNAGFVTKGDNNRQYDQANGLTPPVKPAWVVGTAEFRLPGLGWVRLSTQ